MLRRMRRWGIPIAVVLAAVAVAVPRVLGSDGGGGEGATPADPVAPAETTDRSAEACAFVPT
jgi:hypothetical protein